MDFNTVFERTIDIEKGLVDDPAGGLTKYGISQNSYPYVDIKSLTISDAKSIYKRDFWNKLELDNFPDFIQYQLFDFAVNSGIQTAIRALQRALGVADDGHFGPVSKTAMANTEHTDIIMRLNAERLEFMTRLSNWPENSKGWTRRIAKNLRYGAEDS